MPGTGYPLDAYLIIDNNAIVALCEFYCDMHKHLPFPDMVNGVCQEISNVITALRHFALGEKIFTTKCVQAEFKPERGVIASYNGFDQAQCNGLKSHIHNEIEALDVNMGIIPTLRSMQHAPSKFGSNLSRLSDEDLSLVILALGIANHRNERVYILTDEEDLRSFISWMKSRPEVMKICAHPRRVEGLHSMSYINSAHLQCSFSTEYIYRLFSYLSLNQMNRTMLQGTTKGGLISNTYQRVYEEISASGRIKQRALRGLQA
jgi:hypothetical protein